MNCLEIFRTFGIGSVSCVNGCTMISTVSHNASSEVPLNASVASHLSTNIEEPPSRIFILFNAVNTITHLTLGCVTLVPVLFVFTGTFSAHFQQHIILCVLGYQLLMAQAIMTFNSSNGWSVGLRYQEKKIVHWVLQVAGSALAIAGSAIRINNLGNFNTPHGILGLLAMIFTIISLLGGVVNLYALRLHLRPHIVKLLHAFTGTAAFILAGACLCFGFDKGMFRTWFNASGANTMIACTVIGSVGALMGAFESMYRRVFVRL